MQTPYVFIAGGIGITPFRSMIRYMTDKNISSQVTLFYTVDREDEFLFRDVLEQAATVISLQIVSIVIKAPQGWKGERGYIDGEMIRRYIKDISKPQFYISGPQPMVHAYQDLLQKIGVSQSKIKTDLFSGYDETYTKKI